MGQGRALVRHTLLLTAVSLLLRTAGVAYNVYLTSQLGTVGLGALQLVMTAYAFSITLASSGVRLAITRMVAESQGRGAAALRLGMLWGLCAGSAAAALLACCAEPVGRVWLGLPETVRSLRILAAGLPFVAMSSAINGSFTASGRIVAQATAQIFELAVQVAVTLFLLPRQKAFGLGASCAAISTAIFLSELCSFLFVGLLALARRGNSRPGGPHLLRQFLRIAAPDALGALIGSSLRTAQGLLIVPGLRRSGADSDSAVASYGVIQGMVMPVLLYPSALLLSLAGLLVPEIAQAHARGQKKRIADLVTRVLLLSAVFAIGVSGLTLGLADEISQVIYADRSIAAMLRLFAPLLPLLYLDIVVDGMLKGLDQQLRSMSYNIFEASLGLVLVCGLIPHYGVAGYVATVFVSRTLNALLSLHRLTRVSELSLDLWGGLIKPCGCAAFAAMLARAVIGCVATSGATVLLLIGVGIYALAYLAALLVSRCISPQELRRLAKSVTR